tara:strand:- start:536 stop:1234 length:699 start_codon:yes stop_codon:yes gene_type:complete
MNLGEFQATVSSQGLARNNRWLARIYPPRGLTSSGNILSNLLSKGPMKVNVNLPGLDSLDSAVNGINEILDVGNSFLGTNLAVPTLGGLLTNQKGKTEALNLFCEQCQLPGRDILSTEYRDYGEVRNIGIRHQHGDLTIVYYSSEDLRERRFFENWQDLIFNPSSKSHAYYSDYASRLEISKYNQSWSKEVAEYRFNEVYPTNVGVQELVSTEGELLRLTITFKYHNYERIK